MRAKRKIAEAGIPYEVPPPELLPERLEAAMAVVYLVFNEGYSASRGDALVRADLCAGSDPPRAPARRAASRLGEARGLLALMLLHDARRETRTTPEGELVLLEEQDRTRWNRAQIDEGLALAAAALPRAPAGPYALQAAIAAEHARAPRAEATDWRAITRSTTRSCACGRARWSSSTARSRSRWPTGPAAGSRSSTISSGSGELGGYYLLWATEADLLRRLGRFAEAARCYRRALEQVGTGPERRYLERRLAEVERG